MKRKEFIINSSLALGSVFTGCRSMTSATSEIIKDEFNFDLHTHPGVFFAKGGDMFPGEEAFLARVLEMQSNHIHGAFFSIVADWPLLKLTDTGVVFNGKFNEDEGWNEYKKQLGILKSLLGKSQASLAISLGELHDTKVNAFISCEGGDFIGQNIEHVSQAYEDGVRSIQLVHYAPNLLGDLQTWKAEYGGLSGLGIEVVKQMNRLGMVIDVAHASARTVKMVIDTTTDPVILSHSILNDNKDRPISARAISEEHAKMVSGTGGVIGMWPSGFSNSFEEFVHHTFRMIDVIGIDHVGIGTDMDANFKPVLSNYNEFTDWKSALKEKGLRDDEVDMLAGGNMKRVLGEVL